MAIYGAGFLLIVVSNVVPAMPVGVFFVGFLLFVVGAGMRIHQWRLRKKEHDDPDY
jgi:protein-S-isoprenylcysteine O-methyltransferase Ste14